MSKAAGDEFAMNSVAQSCWDWRRSLWKAMNQRKKPLGQKFKDTTKLFEPNLKWEVVEEVVLYQITGGLRWQLRMRRRKRLKKERWRRDEFFPPNSWKLEEEKKENVLTR